MQHTKRARNARNIISLVKSRERRARLTLKDIGRRKRRAVIMASSSWPAERGRPGGGGSVYGQGGGHGREGSGGGLSGLMRAATGMIPGLSRSSYGNGGGGGGSFSSRQAAVEVGFVTVDSLLLGSRWVRGVVCRCLSEGGHLAVAVCVFARRFFLFSFVEWRSPVKEGIALRFG